MQTQLTQAFLDTAQGQQAEAILRKCVHCGFCNASCPTYQLLGDEADSPRGRIYLIKNMLEGQSASQLTRKHLDRCLLCRACESTCPSGVEYAQLASIGKDYLQQQSLSSASWLQGLQQYWLKLIVPYPQRLRVVLFSARILSPILPQHWRNKIPMINPAAANTFPAQINQPDQRQVILHEGCVQSVVESGINSASIHLLNAVGISVIRSKPVQCCGALHYHLSASEQARQFARNNIDAWWSHIEAGAMAIVSNASGCGLHITEYPKLFAEDRLYRHKALRVAELHRDVVQILEHESTPLTLRQPQQVVAFQSPCTLQHGLQLSGRVEALLKKLGVNITTPENPHLCCGSAGSYSVLQAVIANQLLENKLEALQQTKADVILTANIGCLLHLKTASSGTVMHWVEFLAQQLIAKNTSMLNN